MFRLSDNPPETPRLRLPNGGSAISYENPVVQKYNNIKPHIDNLQRNIDTYKRIQTGQIGPELEMLLKQIGPNGVKKALKKGALTLDVNPLKPYVGFKWNF